MEWDKIVDKINPYIFKIETSIGHGTGFLCMYNEEKFICGIATAAHVIEHADKWKQPIIINHYQKPSTMFLKETDRVVFIDSKKDSAVILFLKSEFNLPENLIPLFTTKNILKIGSGVGWLGFPSIAPYELCFFSGSISAHQEFRSAYLIDGVAINGISGGPVVIGTETEGVQIVGIITAYHGGRYETGTPLGLSIAQDVSHFHEITSYIKSLDEARKKKPEIEQSYKEQNDSIKNHSPKPDKKD